MKNGDGARVKTRSGRFDIASMWTRTGNYRADGDDKKGKEHDCS
jgi:hypothetical protein